MSCDLEKTKKSRGKKGSGFHLGRGEGGDTAVGGVDMRAGLLLLPYLGIETPGPKDLAPPHLFSE